MFSALGEEKKKSISPLTDLVTHSVSTVWLAVSKLTSVLLLFLWLIPATLEGISGVKGVVFAVYGALGDISIDV